MPLLPARVTCTRSSDGQVRSRHTVAVDFAMEGAAALDTRLMQAGFSREAPTIWVLEGLLMYLTPSEQRELMHTIDGATQPLQSTTCACM